MRLYLSQCHQTELKYFEIHVNMIKYNENEILVLAECAKFRFLQTIIIEILFTDHKN